MASPWDIISQHLNGGMPGSAGATVQGAIGQGQGLGYFNAAGSPYIRELIRQGAIRNARNRQRRGMVTSQLFGLDPMAQRQALFDTERQASGDVSNAINEGQSQEAFGNRDYIRSLLGNQLGFEQQQALARLQAKLAQQQQGGAGALFGSLLGQGGIAALLGRGGL